MEEPTPRWNFGDFLKLSDIPRTLNVQLKGSVVIENKSWGQRRTGEVRQD